MVNFGMKMFNKYHNPVLISQVFNALAPLQISGKYIDATLGHGGYAIALSKLVNKILGIEFDPSVIKLVKKRIESENIENISVVNGNFRNIDNIAKTYGFLNADGIIYDLGLNSNQQTDPERGFSFLNPMAKLDMRINPTEQSVTAADLLNVLRKDQLIDLFGIVLDQTEAKKISRLIVESRMKNPFVNVGSFVELCKDIKTRNKRIRPATRPLLALKMAVNFEIENLSESLKKSIGILKKGGRLVVVSFHSAEDKVVKTIFNEFCKNNLACDLNSKLIVPGYLEVSSNPASRSSRLRAIMKL